ncbi:MAG: response regulator [Planctomycetaceae bacterium]|nr:response regulator [Planctomycetaceae bacterium]
MANNNSDLQTKTTVPDGESSQTTNSVPDNSDSQITDTKKWTFIGIREKLILLFLVVKILPMVLLAFIAWRALVQLGNTLQDASVNDSREALVDMAVENIERISTNTAQKVAEFLYDRDADIAFLAGGCAHLAPDGDISAERLERFLKDYSDNKARLVRRPGNWKVAPDGMSWVQTDPYTVPQEKGKRSVNKENEDTVDGATFSYRPPYGYGDSRQNFIPIPLYDEIAYIDKDGKQIAKYINPQSTKKRHPFTKELVSVADPKNTYVRAENYFGELKKLGKDGIYVSDVIGAYVPCRFVGMYTPNFMASKKIDAKIAELEKDGKDAELVWNLRVLNAELKNEGEKFNSKSPINAKIRAEIDRRLGKGEIWEIKSKNIEQTSETLKELGLAELGEAITKIPFKPEEEAYAGAENPLGIRFEGIVRWAKPVLNGKTGEVNGWITFALNYDHVLDIIDHITPTSQRYCELSDAFDGNYAFIWDYQCRSIVHPRHHSMYGFNPETGKPETPWLEKTLYDSMIEAGYKREDWQDYIATLKDYEPWTGDTDSLAFQSRSKKPAPELTKLGLVGLDGRYLNNAPQCTGWMDLTRDGGSGSLFILWSGVYKLQTVAAVPYYTGQYSPESRGNRIGFGFVAVGTGIDDFIRPADTMGDKLTKMVNSNLASTSAQLIIATVILSVIVVFIAIWMASYLSNRLQWLIHGISHFRSGNRHFRFQTDRKDEFGQLADSFDDMAENIVHSVHSPLVITDKNLNIIYANDYALTITGHKTLNDIIGKAYPEKGIYPFGSEFCPITALRNDSGKAKVFCEERSGRYIQGTANYFKDVQGRVIGYIITSSDVTDLSKKQIELEQATVVAEAASRHKSDFLARMSHELRTPMNAILGMNNITQSKIRNIAGNSDIAELGGYLEQLKNSSNHLLSLLNDVLDISKLETGSIELLEKPLNIFELLKEVEGVLRLNGAGKKLSLTVKFAEFTPSYFVADGLRLRQVLNNLLDNAVKFTPESGSVEFIVERKDRSDGKALLLFTVRDSGVGIAPEVLETIFQPFEQVNARQNVSGSSGSGLGLPIAQKILKLFGSEMHVQSKIGKGSEFSFSLWLREDENSKQLTTQDVKGLFSGQTALVIDDVFINRMVLVALLKEAGFKTEEAKDGAEGLLKFANSPENSIDIVFMDIQMPVMNGYDSAASIRQLGRADAKTVPIVAISANAFQEDIDKSLISGMNSHYAKPIKMDALSSILMQYCKTKKQP